MEHVGDAQAVFRRHLPHTPQYQRQLRARDGAIHAVIIGRDAAHRRKGGLAAGPKQQPLLLRIRGAAGYRAALPRDLLDAIEQMVDFGARTIQLDDQERLDIERITGMDEFLGGVDGQPVHHLHAAGNDAGADDARDAFAAVFRGDKTDQRCAR